MKNQQILGLAVFLMLGLAVMPIGVQNAAFAMNENLPEVGAAGGEISTDDLSPELQALWDLLTQARGDEYYQKYETTVAAILEDSKKNGDKPTEPVLSETTKAEILKLMPEADVATYSKALSSLQELPMWDETWYLTQYIQMVEGGANGAKAPADLKLLADSDIKTNTRRLRDSLRDFDSSDLAVNTTRLLNRVMQELRGDKNVAVARWVLSFEKSSDFTTEELTNMQAAFKVVFPDTDTSAMTTEEMVALARTMPKFEQYMIIAKADAGWMSSPDSTYEWLDTMSDAELRTFYADLARAAETILDKKMTDGLMDVDAVLAPLAPKVKVPDTGIFAEAGAIYGLSVVAIGALATICGAGTIVHLYRRGIKM